MQQLGPSSSQGKCTHHKISMNWLVWSSIGRKIGFAIKNETEAQGLSHAKSKGTLTVLRCISGPNWETTSKHRTFIMDKLKIR